MEDAIFEVDHDKIYKMNIDNTICELEEYSRYLYEQIDTLQKTTGIPIGNKLTTVKIFDFIISLLDNNEPTQTN